jgi:hypothetical protein
VIDQYQTSFRPAFDRAGLSIGTESKLFSQFDQYVVMGFHCHLPELLFLTLASSLSACSSTVVKTCALQTPREWKCTASSVESDPRTACFVKFPDSIFLIDQFQKLYRIEKTPNRIRGHKLQHTGIQHRKQDYLRVGRLKGGMKDDGLVDVDQALILVNRFPVLFCGFFLASNVSCEGKQRVSGWDNSP